MKRVKGAFRNAIILFAAVLAGALVFFHLLSSPLTADAASDPSVVSLFIPDEPHSSEQAVDSLNDAQPERPETIIEVDENPSPASKLTGGQLQRLREASLDYVALTPASGIQMARSLNVVKDDGDPTNICGPLSIAILRDAGLVDPYLKIRDFWLLNPNNNRRLLDQTFPSERFEHFQLSTPLNEIDWKSFPLMPRDFLYLFTGSKGTFEHMHPDARTPEQYGGAVFDTTLAGYGRLGEAIFEALVPGGVCAFNIDGPVRVWRPELGESERSLIAFKVAIDWAERIVEFGMPVVPYRLPLPLRRRRAPGYGKLAKS